MTGLLICAAVVAVMGALMIGGSGVALQKGDRSGGNILKWCGLALIAAALYLAWRAGGAGA